MVRERVRSWFLGEREKLAPMSPKQKWEYIWGYYKWWILGFVLLIVIIVSGVQNMRYQRRELLISGVFINTSTSAEGYAFVNEDYWAYAGADEGTRVELIEARSIRYNAEQPTGYDVNDILSIDTQIAAKTLDYIIGDAEAMEFYDQQKSLLDLSGLLTQEQLSALPTVSTENGTVAVDLTGSTLAGQFGLSAEPSYMFFLANTPRKESCIAFLEYLFQNQESPE